MSQLKTNIKSMDEKSQQLNQALLDKIVLLDQTVSDKDKVAVATVATPVAGEFIDAKDASQSRKINKEIFVQNQKRIRHMIIELVNDEYDEATQGDFLLELCNKLSAYETSKYHVIDVNKDAEFVTDFVKCTSYIYYEEKKPAKKGEEAESRGFVIELSDQYAIVPLMLKSPTDQQFKNDELVVFLVKSVDAAQTITVRKQALISPKHFKDEINKLAKAGFNTKERIGGKPYDLLTSLSKIVSELKRNKLIEVRKGSVSAGWHIAGEHIEHIAPGNKNYAGTFSQLVRKNGDAKSSFDFYRRIVSENPLVAISLAMSISGLMRGCALPKHESKIFHLHGKSSTGKTLLLKLSAAMIGSPNPGGLLVSSWDASMPALENILMNSTHSFLCLDEIQQMLEKDFSPKTKLMSIINGTSALKSTQTGELRDGKAWELSILSTGNVPIDFQSDSQQEAVFTRVINLDIDQNPIFGFGSNPGKAIEIENFIQDNFGHLYESLTEIIAKNRAIYRANYEKRLQRINELSAWAGADASALARQSKGLADVQAGVDVLKDVLNLKEEQVMLARAQLVKMIENGFKSAYEMKAYIKPDFINELRGFVTSNINRINVKNVTRGVKDDNARVVDWMGRLDSSDYDEWNESWTGTLFMKENKVKDSDLKHYKSLIRKARDLGFLVTQASRLAKGEMTVSVRGFGDCHKIMIADVKIAPVEIEAEATQVIQNLELEQVVEDIPW